MVLPSDPVLEFKPGSVRGTPGYFRLAESTAGAWWFLDPAGQPFFFRGVNGVEAVEGSPEDPTARLRRWGFNALGAGSEPALRADGWPFVATVDFAPAGNLIRAGGVRLPDVFDPEWPKAAGARAGEVCPPLAGRSELVGWITDDRLGWSQSATDSRPGLLQCCLSLEPSFAAYHAAWEFVLALHGGRVEALAKAWGHPIPNKETVRELTRSEQGLATRGYVRDDARWSREFARRYFALTAAAIRAHDPHHLIFGCRFGGRAAPAVLAECVYPAVDAPWIDLDDLPFMAPGPLVAGDFSWVDPRFIQEPGARRPRGLTAVERMLRRGRTALERATRQPAVAGFAWSEWRDGPGEQPPFARGLTHGNDAEAREHTELLTDINARADQLRRGGTGARA